MLDSDKTNLDLDESSTDEFNPSMSVFDEDGSGQPNKNPQERSPINPDEFIAPQFANLPKDEAIVRSAQSYIDSMTDSMKKAEAKYEDTLPTVRAFDQLTTDKDFLRSFVKQYDPEFFSQFQASDVSDRVKQTLAKKYGADFEPDPNEVAKYGSRSWEYDREFNKLYDNYSSKSPDSIKPLDTLIKERRKDREKDENIKRKQIKQIMDEENWDMQQVKFMMNWANNLSLFDVKKIFKFTMRNVGKAPSPTEVKGQLPGLPQFEKVNELFGPPRSGPSIRKPVQS